MKAIVKTINGAGYYVRIDGIGDLGFLMETVNKKIAENRADQFNLALSSHVAKETEELQSEIAELKAEVQKIDYEYRNMTRKYKKAIDEVDGLKAEVERLKGVGHTPHNKVNNH